ncbi:helix-turn-helix domain-containing protein [Streptomyces sp. NPDC048612]|uniref:transcriptional regulator n=1 Tax=Streptomyces sp. NPDC048612 TaxID=3365579 RepID=UPI003714B546
MQVLRVRRGMSRTVLAGLLGKSPSWVKQVEGGRLQMPKLPMVLRIAEAPRVPSLADLVGSRATSISLFAGPGHARLPQVRDALNTYPLTTVRQAPPATHLKHRIAHAWQARHSAPHHRDVLGELLPHLLRDAQASLAQAESGTERRAAQSVLSEV